jgi:hypothetical protein
VETAEKKQASNFHLYNTAIWMYFVSICENRRMRSIEIVLRRGEEKRGRTMERVNPTEIYLKHICKYYNVYLIPLLYTNKPINKK